jgi:hypothetical protein
VISAVVGSGQYCLSSFISEQPTLQVEATGRILIRKGIETCSVVYNGGGGTCLNQAGPKFNTCGWRSSNTGVSFEASQSRKIRLDDVGKKLSKLGEIRAVLRSRSKILLLNSPNNMCDYAPSCPKRRFTYTRGFISYAASC